MADPSRAQMQAEYAELTEQTIYAWLQYRRAVSNLAGLHARRRILAAALTTEPTASHDQAIDAHILAGLDFETPDLTCRLHMGDWPPPGCTNVADLEVEFIHACNAGVTQRACKPHWVSAGQRFWRCSKCGENGMQRSEVMRIAGEL